jgi:hypothetical protein
MGSGVLLAALVVLWFVVLVPMVVTRGDGQGRRAGADTGRTLQRRRSVDPARLADTERVDIDRATLYSTGELRVDVHKVRRRTLGALVTLALASAVAAVLLGGWVWVAQGVLDLAVVGYVLVLRRAARRERLAARRAARAAAREARLARAVPRPAVDEELHATVAQESLPSIPQQSEPLAAVRTLRPGRVVAARTSAPAGWQSSAVVGLDDDDLGFADIDEYQPRRVVNA